MKQSSSLTMSMQYVKTPVAVKVDEHVLMLTFPLYFTTIPLTNVALLLHTDFNSRICQYNVFFTVYQSCGRHNVDVDNMSDNYCLSRKS